MSGGMSCLSTQQVAAFCVCQACMSCLAKCRSCSGSWVVSRARLNCSIWKCCSVVSWMLPFMSITSAGWLQGIGIIQTFCCRSHGSPGFSVIPRLPAWSAASVASGSAKAQKHHHEDDQQDQQDHQTASARVIHILFISSTESSFWSSWARACRSLI